MGRSLVCMVMFVSTGSALNHSDEVGRVDHQEGDKVVNALMYGFSEDGVQVFVGNLFLDVWRLNLLVVAARVLSAIGVAAAS